MAHIQHVAGNMAKFRDAPESLAAERRTRSRHCSRILLAVLACDSPSDRSVSFEAIYTMKLRLCLYVHILKNLVFL